MKKLFIIAAAASVTLASCVKNEPNAALIGASEDVLAFDSPVLLPNTKVAEVPTTFGQESFKVWALHTADSYTAGGSLATAQRWIDGATVSDLGGTDKFVAAKAYYWPKSGYLQVSAVYPASVDATVGDSGVKIEDYTVGAAANQVDLLFSNREYNVIKAKDGDENTLPIPVVFNHALSAVNFKVSASDGPAIILKSITLKNVDNTGDFDQGLAVGKPAVADAETSSCWTLSGNNESYVVPLADAFSSKLTSTAAYVHTGGETAAYSSALMLLPQDLSDVTVDIEYTMDGMNQSTSIPLTGSWLRGYKYTYTLTFGAEVIQFTASVDTWETGSADPGTSTIQ